MRRLDGKVIIITGGGSGIGWGIANSCAREGASLIIAQKPDDIAIADARRIDLNETVEIVGPCVLAFDGERERVMKAGQRATLSVRRDGPRVIDIKSTLEVAARDGAMIFPTAEGVRHAG